MNFRLLGVGVAAAAASLLAPQQAHALVATTTYVPFKIYQEDSLNSPINFAQNFLTAAGLTPGVANLTGIGFKIAGAADGTGTATVGGNPRVGNGDDTLDSVASINWAPKFSFLAPGAFPVTSAGPVTSTTGSKSGVPCVAVQTCGTPGGTSIPAGSFRTLNLNGNSYTGSGGFASINNSWQTGVAYTTSESANFNGTGTNPLLFDFNPTVGSPATVADKPFIQGFIAVQYQYNLTAPVPGPLPLFGAAAAFGWSRRLRKRITSVV
jgi:hypothetical protein